MVSDRRLSRIITLLAATLLIGVFGCGGDLDSRLAEIRTLQDGGKFEESIEPLRGLVTTNSAHPEVNYRLGLALVQTGRRSLAIWPLNKAANSEEYGLQAGVLLAATLMSTEDYAESARAADRVLELDPDNKAALYTRAQANLYGSDPEAALADTARLLEFDPKDSHAFAVRIGALIDLERLDEAEKLQFQMLDIAADDGDIEKAGRMCAALSVLFLKTEREDRAMDIHRDCLERFPNDVMVRTAATEYYETKGMFSEAAELYARAVEHTPEDPALRVTLARLLSKAGRKAEGDAAMAEMVELFDSVDAWRKASFYRRTTGETTKAREAIEEAISRFSGDAPMLQFELGDLLVEEGNLDRAREVAEGLEEPAYADLLSGSIALADNDPETAMKFFESGLRRWPNNAGARFLTGAAAEQLGDKSRAIAEYREAIRNDETRTDAALRLAEILFADAEYSTSLDFANRHLMQRPFVGPDAHLISARSAAKTGKIKAAQATLGDLVKRPEYEVLALIELASLSAMTGAPSEAADALQRAYEEVDGASEDDLLISSLISHLIESNRASEALALAQKERAKSNSPMANDLVGRVLMRQGRLEDAKKSFDAALSSDENFASAIEGLGALAFANNNFEVARSYFDRAAELDGTNADFLYRGAQATLALGETDAAIERLEKTIEVKPAHAGACNDLAWLLAETGGDLDHALRLASRATRVHPGPFTADTLGWVHLRRNDATAAAAAFRGAIADYGGSPTRHYHLGLALGQQGQTEKALEVLRQAVAADSFPDAAAANAEIERLEKLL
ncbi:MAG: tetratricopeptide repeat protein [Myxococcota bacterium]|nr:tetratricopeptide repeat protein [Myxococcota bacterium]